MQNKQKLELTWIGKGKEPKLEPRLLIEDPEKSYGDPNSENILIHGDNLLALKALEQDFTGKIKCIYIDPPYNTGSAFEHYDDNLEHSIWLSLMKPRLELLKRLLHPTEGSIWISIDDDECHYLKVLCDEVFSRKNFVSNIVWQKRTSPDARATIGAGHESILVYCTNLETFRNSLNPLPLTKEQIGKFKNPDNDPRGPWVSSDFTAQGFRPNQMYEIITPGGKSYKPQEGRCWKNVENVYLRLVKEGRMWFGKEGKGVPRRKTYLKESKGAVPWTWWPNNEVGHNQEAKKEIIELFGLSKVFATPKPERLIQRIIHLSTTRDDWVLDSFLGSGTSAAVAHKMERNYIGIELGNHAITHCLPRLKKVVDGVDGLELSKTLNWKGGGGFKFYNLAPSLLKKDHNGNWIFDKTYNSTLLAAAVCKHEGFRFKPDDQSYWKQGKSTESDYIFITTNFLTLEQLDSIHSEMKPNESLLICSKSYSSECINKYSNITIKKIPQVILGKCEFGAENYDLNITQETIMEADIQESYL